MKQHIFSQDTADTNTPTTHPSSMASIRLQYIYNALNTFGEKLQPTDRAILTLIRMTLACIIQDVCELEQQHSLSQVPPCHSGQNTPPLPSLPTCNRMQ